MEDLVWEAPTFKENRGGKRSSKWKTVAQRLQEKKGDWALLKECKGRGSAYSLASTIRTGRGSAWAPKGAFTARAEEKDGSGWVVYARYIGEMNTES